MCPLILLLAMSSATYALDNGLLRTPPMGWMAWERFRCNVDCANDPKHCISENLFKDMADRLAEDGWKDLGYEYIMIDDCWMSMERDKDGRLQPDPKSPVTSWPQSKVYPKAESNWDGLQSPVPIASLAKYVHNRGLKLGIYANMGYQTCMGYPGTNLGTINTDAQTFASWGVDFLKFDGCFSNPVEQQLGYPLMSKALNATGRPIAYSCSWPCYRGGLPPKVNYTLLGEICNVWRNWYDVQDSWDSIQSILDWFTDNQDELQPAAGPGHWNDPDMLIIGNFGLSIDQSRAQMALWAIMAAPLIMSNDLRSLEADARAVLSNKLVIAINQDPLGIQGRRIWQEATHVHVYWRPLSHTASSLVFLSRRHDMPHRYTTSLSRLNYPTGDYEAYDVFSGKLVKGLKTTTTFTVTINPSGVVMWYIYPTTYFKKTKNHSRYRLLLKKYNLSFSESGVGPHRII